MTDKLIDLLDTARYKYQEYEAEKDHRMRTAKTEAEFDAEANTYETRHSFYARELRNNGVTVQECCHKAESVISQTGLMCTACYSDIDRDAVFCKYCGAKVMP